MLLNRQRFIDIHTYLLTCSAALYLLGIFGTKVLQPGLILVLGLCRYNMLNLHYFTPKEKGVKASQDVSKWILQN